MVVVESLAVVEGLVAAASAPAAAAVSVPPLVPPAPVAFFHGTESMSTLAGDCTPAECTAGAGSTAGAAPGARSTADWASVTVASAFPPGLGTGDAMASSASGAPSEAGARSAGGGPGVGNLRILAHCGVFDAPDDRPLPQEVVGAGLVARHGCRFYRLAFGCFGMGRRLCACARLHPGRAGGRRPHRHAHRCTHRREHYPRARREESPPSFRLRLRDDCFLARLVRDRSGLAPVRSPGKPAPVPGGDIPPVKFHPAVREIQGEVEVAAEERPQGTGEIEDAERRDPGE